MDYVQLEARLARGDIVALKADNWQAVAERYPVRARHDTGIAGELLILDRPQGALACETPRSGEVVLRPLADAAVAAFVADRLATYDRMWDGCGCKIDYYG